MYNVKCKKMIANHSNSEEALLFIAFLLNQKYVNQEKYVTNIFYY